MLKSRLIPHGIGMSDKYLGTVKQRESETYSYNSRAFMHLISY